MGKYGVKDGDVVVLRQTDRRPPPTQPAFPGNIYLIEIYSILKNNFRYVTFSKLLCTILLLLFLVLLVYYNQFTR